MATSAAIATDHTRNPQPRRNHLATPSLGLEILLASHLIFAVKCRILAPICCPRRAARAVFSGPWLQISRMEAANVTARHHQQSLPTNKRLLVSRRLTRTCCLSHDPLEQRLRHRPAAALHALFEQARSASLSGERICCAKCAMCAVSRECPTLRAGTAHSHTTQPTHPAKQQPRGGTNSLSPA